MQAMEFNRNQEDRFYVPRRSVLYRHARALQRLADRDIDELFLSQPPRTGKSCLTTFFITWLVGRDPERSNLYVSYSDPLTKAFYDGVLEFMEDNFTYQWSEIFPERKITGRNSKDETFDVDRNKKYHSFTSRSLFGTLNGSCDCNGCLIADDLLSGIEEALNPDRLQKTWVTVDNNMLSRAKENAGIVWVGTRWSLADPIGRRLSLLETDPKYKDRRFTVINIPALNEKDESNFNYKFGVGFSSAYYRQRRASFENNNDLASWAAQYQGEPYERSTQVFDPSYFRYYNGELPEGEPDRVFTKIDPAFGGGDYTAAPIVYQYGEEFYVHDVIFNSGNKSVTQPLIARKAEANKITAMRMEANKSTESYADGLREELERIGYHLSVITEPAPSNIAKQSRILDKASDIFTYFIFRDSAHRSQEYEKFMQNVFSYKLNSPRQHDDAPDSLAMTVGMAMQRPAPKAYAFRRPV
jgi:predicted phage terminase large subunit-like protein